MMRVLIVGGGVAGLVTAMALQRAGIDPTVYEAYDESAGLIYGAYLTVAVNGLDALGAVGLRELVEAAGFPTGSIRLFSGTGKFLAEVPMGPDLSDGSDGVTTVTLKRSDLYRVLGEEAARRGIPVEYGKRLAGAEAASSGGGVVARFADGTEAEGDLLIGADGVHSVTRRTIDPGAPEPRYTGLGNVGGFTREAKIDAEPGLYTMIFGKRCFFGYTVAPDGEVWWFANPPSKEEVPRAVLAATATEQWKGRLIGLLADDRGPAAEIVRSTTEEFRVTNQYDMPSVPTWHRGAVVIIGDAAHAVAPSSGQGVSMAAEDAVTLARCLRDLPEDAERALAAYEKIRRGRVGRVVAFGARMGNAKAAGPVARVLRDLVLPTIMKRQASPKATQSLSWLFEHHVDWDAPVAPATTRTA